MARGDGKEQQDWLVSYLQTRIDPHDFPQHFLLEWAEARSVGGVDDQTYADSLTPEQLEDYAQWLKESNAASRWVEEDPYYSAPYLTMYGARALPEGTWCVHFTNASPFDAFDRGATIDASLHLSALLGKKTPVDCERNLDFQRAGPGEVVWGFAFEADKMSPWALRASSKKYGKHAILFQTDRGVRVYHSGDEEDQVVFPLCTERNLVPFTVGYDGEVSAEDEDGNELTFPSLEALIENVSMRSNIGLVEPDPFAKLLELAERARGRKFEWIFATSEPDRVAVIREVLFDWGPVLGLEVRDKGAVFAVGTQSLQAFSGFVDALQRAHRNGLPGAIEVARAILDDIET